MHLVPLLTIGACHSSIAYGRALRLEHGLTNSTVSEDKSWNSTDHGHVFENSGNERYCTNAFGNFEIELNSAIAIMDTVGWPTSPGRSGYPHRFHNYNGLIDFNQEEPHCECDDDTHVCYEFPIFADFHTYPWQTKPKPDPGSSRLVYVNHLDTGIFCGIIAHDGSEGTPNSGRFNLCGMRT